MKKYLITYEKKKFLHYEVEAESLEEAIETADYKEEKFGYVTEYPYFLSTSREKEES